MLRLRSDSVLKELGIDYWSWCIDSTQPELSELTFADVAPALADGGPRARQILDKRLYRHQVEALKALEEGKNVILISGTGSGKTEAWALFTIRKKAKTLVIYPNLALTADQVSRLIDYFPSSVARVDRVSLKAKDASSSRLPSKGLVVITNPAFLMADLKRWAANPMRAYLQRLLDDLELIVIDEFDYYGSHGASLLIAIAELLANIATKSVKPRIVVMTATLGSEEELAKRLTDINERETVVVRGRPFRVSNCTYAILGKDLDLLRDMIKEHIKRAPPEVADMILDPEKFKANAPLIMNLLRKHGVRIPSPYLDPAELLARYVDDEVVTIVFTPSIRSASKLVRRIRSLLPSNKRDMVVEHHHLVKKELRERIESLARSTPPKIRVIVTVRTLLQGIDIGTVARIVHYGLPQDIREYHQREGRKGRRKELGFTETVIIPVTRWDRMIISGGPSSLRLYAGLHLEKVYVATNEYVKLFTGLMKIVSGAEPSQEELELLLRLGLIKRSEGIVNYELTRKGIYVWQNLGFYEFGPPYNIPRYVMGKKGKRLVEGISRKDLVEKFQPGMIDYSHEAIVTELVGDRRVSQVIEVELSDLITGSVSIPQYLRDALAKYRELRELWGERPDILLDVNLGKIDATVTLSITLPTKGFGPYVELPLDVVWEVESRRKYRIVRYGDRLIQIYDSKGFELASPVKGRYEDFTTVVRAAVPSMSSGELRAAASAILLYLRLSRKYAVSPRELRVYIQEAFKPYEVAFFETQASGILNIIDWAELATKMREFEENPLWLPLLWLIDPEVATDVVSTGKTWREIAELGARLATAIAGGKLTRVFGLDIVIPTKAKKNVYAVEVEELGLPNGVAVVVATMINGERSMTKTINLGPTDPPTPVDRIVYEVLSDAEYEEAVVATTSDLRRYAVKRKTMATIDLMRSENRLVNPFSELERCVHGTISLDEVAAVLDVDVSNLTRIPENIEELEKRMRTSVSLTYGAYLLLEALRSSGRCSDG